MGNFFSKQAPVAGDPISTTTTVLSAVPSTMHTPTDEFKAAEVSCWINNHEILLYMSLAFISGVLLVVLVFAVIYLFRKSCKRAHQNLREGACSRMAAEESCRNTQPQNEVTYSTVIFQRGRTPLPE